MKDVKIGTITCSGRVTDKNDKNVLISIYKLSQQLEISNTVLYIQYMDRVKIKLNYSTRFIYHKCYRYLNPWYNENNYDDIINESCVTSDTECQYNNGQFSIIIKKGAKNPKKVQKKKIKKTNYFRNAMIIELLIDNSRIHCKVSTSGHIELTGAKSISACHKVFEYLNKLFNQCVNIQPNMTIVYNDKNIYLIYQDINRYIPNNTDICLSLDEIRTKYPHQYIDIKSYVTSLFVDEKIFLSNTVIVKFYRIDCIMCHFTIDLSCESLDLELLYKFIKSLDRNDINVVYKNTKNKPLQLRYTSKRGIVITYMILRTGKFNMTNIKDMEHMKEGYDFIHDFIKNNIKSFTLTDTISRAIDLINNNTKCVQRTKEWFEFRKSHITASTVGFIIMDNPPYKTYDEFIREKALEILGHDIFVTNDAMKFGTMMEPYAQKILVEILGNKNHVLYDTSVYEKGFIAASPDGLILKFNNKYHNGFGFIKENIYDACLVEIKCPSNYKPVIKSLKEEKPLYYWQIQQQLYVTDMKYCVFMNCKFILVDKEKYENELHKYKGILPDGRYYILDAYDIHEIDYAGYEYTKHIKKLENAMKDIEKAVIDLKDVKFTDEFTFDPKDLV